MHPNLRCIQGVGCRRIQGDGGEGVGQVLLLVGHAPFHLQRQTLWQAQPVKFIRAWARIQPMAPCSAKVGEFYCAQVDVVCGDPHRGAGFAQLGVMPHTGFSKQGVGRNLVVALEGACGRRGGAFFGPIFGHFHHVRRQETAFLVHHGQRRHWTGGVQLNAVQPLSVKGVRPHEELPVVPPAKFTDTRASLLGEFVDQVALKFQWGVGQRHHGQPNQVFHHLGT